MCVFSYYRFVFLTYCFFVNLIPGRGIEWAGSPSSDEFHCAWCEDAQRHPGWFNVAAVRRPDPPELQNRELRERMFLLSEASRRCNTHN